VLEEALKMFSNNLGLMPISNYDTIKSKLVLRAKQLITQNLVENFTLFNQTEFLESKLGLKTLQKILSYLEVIETIYSELFCQLGTLIAILASDDISDTDFKDRLLADKTFRMLTSDIFFGSNISFLELIMSGSKAQIMPSNIMEDAGCPYSFLNTLYNTFSKINFRNQGNICVGSQEPCCRLFETASIDQHLRHI